MARILMLLPQPFFEPRGTSFSSLHRLRTLAYMGHQVDLLTYPFGRDISYPNVRIVRIPRLPCIREARVGPSREKLFLDMVWMIPYSVRMLLRRRYDLIHTHEEACFWGAVLARWRGIPHLYDMHSSLPQQLLNFKFTTSGLALGLFRWAEKKTLRNADGVIAICPELAAHAKSIAPHTPITVIENVLELDPPPGARPLTPETLRERYHLQGHKVVLYTGTFEPYQGIDLLIRAAPEVIRQEPRAIFLLVGGRSDQVAYYRHLAEQQGVADSCVFVGAVAPERIKDFYGVAHVLVSPRFEGTNTPLKIYSYLRSGVPIVATDHITHTQVLSREVAVLTGIEPSALAQGIVRILVDPALARRLVAAAQRLAEERYSPVVYRAKLRALVEQVIDRRPKQPREKTDS
ncbi:MAG: glycosyltransferase family 4 protein [bacterium]|nr:glycosyltransferase family 4 protein [candidate division KSB1 bacterium]MDH7560615.1 glycosyltransferase family 4 protein [bacterium]